MKFNEGDIVVGIAESDFKYNLTNSHFLMQVIEYVGETNMWVKVIESEYDRDKITAHQKEFATISDKQMEKTHCVDPNYFKLATAKDKTRFLVWRI